MTEKGETADSVLYLAPGQGTTFHVLGGDVITFKITGEQTNNEFTMMETVTGPNEGPPLHLHKNEEETFYVAQGSFVFHIGERRIMAGQGSVLVAPRNVPHRFVNVGTTPGRLIIIVRPSGFENFIREFAALPTDQAPDMAKLKEIGDRYGIEFLMKV